MAAHSGATKDVPRTGWDSKGGNSALQNHVSFFDRDKDGIIRVSDTYNSLRELGFGYFWSILSTFAIHLAFSWVTWGTLIPDPYLRLRVNRIHKAKHGSDTGIYTNTGKFDPVRFDYVFDVYTEAPHTEITLTEMWRMVRADRNPFDPFGWFCAIFEWIPLFIMLFPPVGEGVSREDMKRVYDGSIFWRIAERNKLKMSQNRRETRRYRQK